MIDLRQMRQFVAVAEELNCRAAERLNMSQINESGDPTDRRRYRRQALHRGKRKVTLTRTGEVMLTESHRVLAQADRALAYVMDVVRGRLGRVEIGSSSPPPTSFCRPSPVASGRAIRIFTWNCMR